MSAPLAIARRSRGSWAVVHEPTGVAALIGLRNKRDATVALARLAALPIRWDTVQTETRPAVGEGRLALPERTVTVITDPESRRLIRDEQGRIVRGRS